MPMFDFDFNRSVSRLNLSTERSGIFTSGLIHLELHDEPLQRFNAVVARFALRQQSFTLDQIAAAARRVLRAAAKGQESAFIKVRMRRAGEIRAACNDSMWSVAPELESDLRALLAYLNDPVGLIADDVPVVGMLDDAILVDIAMDTIRAELDAYASFCRFRSAEAARQDYAANAITINRAQWQAERDEEMHLEQQLRRVRSNSYARNDGAERAFRVC